MNNIDTVTIPREAAEEIVRFYGKCREAEKFFEVCQAPSYRRFVDNLLSQASTKQAFDKVSASLTEPKTPQAGKAPKMVADGKKNASVLGKPEQEKVVQEKPAEPVKEARQNA